MTEPDLSILLKYPSVATIQRIISEIYSNGIKADAIKTSQYCKMSAHNGDPKSQYLYAMKIYDCAYPSSSENILQREDLLEASKLLTSSAEKNNIDAQYQMSILTKGRFTSDSFKWLVRAANNNHGKAMYDLADQYFEKQDFENAFKWYLEYINKNNEDICYIRAYHRIGDMIYDGLGAEVSYYAAIHYYEHVLNFIQLGHRYDPVYTLQTEIIADIHHRLGDMYYRGIDADIDYQKALEHYKQCIEITHQDRDELYYQLYQMYKFGLGVEIDILKSNEYLRIAAKNGHPEAQFQLGSKLFAVTIQMVSDDAKQEFYNKAIDQLMSASDNDHVDACLLIGRIYWEMDVSVCTGVNCEKCGKTYTYWLKARELDHERADVYYYLAIMYHNGYYVQQDYEEAISLFEMFLKYFTENDARNIFIEHHENIEYKDTLRKFAYPLDEVKKNYPQAFRCCSILAQHDNINAKYILGWLYWNGLGTEQNKTETFKWHFDALLNDKTDELKEIRKQLKSYENEIVIHKLTQMSTDHGEMQHLKTELDDSKKQIDEMKEQLKMLTQMIENKKHNI